MTSSPSIFNVVLCGSRSAYPQIRALAAELEQHHIGADLPVDIDIADGDRGMLATLKAVSFRQFHDIAASADAVIAVNPSTPERGNYVGPHTLVELGIARAINTPVFALYPPTLDLPWSEELEALDLDLLASPVAKSLINELSARPRKPADTGNAPGGETFKLERIKYIHQQIDRLNGQVDKYLVFYQTVITAIVTATALVFATRSQLRLESEDAKLSLKLLIGLALLSGGFVTVMILAGIRAWLDYRLDEVAAYSDVLDEDYRDPPSWKNAGHWTETWLILFVLLTSLMVAAGIWFLVMPALE